MKRIALVVFMICTAIMGIGLAQVAATDDSFASADADMEPLAGDDFGDATPIEEGTHSGTLVEDESDFYQISLEDGDSIQVDLTYDADATGSPQFTIYDSSGDFVRSSESRSSPATDTSVERVGLGIDTDDTYYIEVSQLDDSVTDYTLSIDRNNEDPNQPNGNFNTATEITAGTYEDPSLLWDASDYYKISLEDGDSIQADLTYDADASGSPRFTIYDSSGDFVRSSESLSSPATDTTVERVGLGIDANDTYYIEVSQLDHSITDYTLSVERNDADPNQPNGNFDTATEITAGTYEEPSLLWDASDYYKISLEDGDSIQADLTYDADASGSPQFTIYDSSGDFVRSSESRSSPATDTSVERVGLGIDTDDTYYIEVSQLDHSITDYTLSVDRNDEDSNQPNGNFNSATEITAGTYEEPSLLWDASDYYKISLEDGDSIQADLTYDADAAGSPRFTIYDSSGDFVRSSESLSSPATDTSVERVGLGIDTDDTYYIEVSQLDHSITDYTLSIDRNNEDSNQPNGNFNTATEITAGTYEEPSLLWDASDYYQISLEDGDSIQADLTYDADASGSPQFTIYDSSGDFVERSTTQSSPTSDVVIENVTREITSDGTYFIEVSQSDHSITDYTLSVDVTPEEPDQEPLEAQFSTSPTTPEEGETVTFDAGASTPADAIDTYEWDLFGNGSVDATGDTVLYAYEDAGEYDITLTVTGTDDRSDTTTQTVSVDSIPDDPEGDTPIAEYADDTGVVQITGVLQAVEDYSTGEIGITVALEVINAYGSGQDVTVSEF